MDFNRSRDDADRRGLLRPRSYQSNSSTAQSTITGEVESQAQSSPLPQNQWSQVPFPYQSRDWDELEFHRPSAPVFGPDLSLSPNTIVNDGSLYPSGTTQSFRRRRRPRELRSRRRQDDGEFGTQTVDVSLLYPQMSPYEPLPNAYSTPADLQSNYGRSISQPNTPDARSLLFDVSEPAPNALPRSPTYPPGGRRRMHSVSAVSDAAFADAHEYRLFVEATSGLSGPEHIFRPPLHLQLHAPGSSQGHTEENSRALFRQNAPEELVSPLEETPTTRYALQQLAQMPEAASQPQPGRRQRLQASASGLELWLPPPSAPTGILAVPDVSPLDDLGLVDGDFDDELPDYAESQAQAQAHQRAEAARRAQELQRRWQQSGSRRGI